MLTLGRKLHETVEMSIPAGTVITEEMTIKVMVVKVGRGQIKLGIDAPRCFKILREELLVKETH